MWLKVLRQNISHFARRTKGNVCSFIRTERENEMLVVAMEKVSIYRY